jgi:very-short-patch-repair endonuclease
MEGHGEKGNAALPPRKDGAGNRVIVYKSKTKVLGGDMRGEQPWRSRRAQSLRSLIPNAERELWNALRNRRLGGFKFVRQAPIGPYFVDFLCREERLVIEVDGGTHSTDVEVSADQARDAALLADGYRVFRVHNGDVYHNLPGVLDALLALLSETSPLLPACGEKMSRRDR